MGWVLALLTGFNLLNYFDRYLLAALLPRVQVDLALDNFHAGLAGSAFMLGYCALSPLFGHLGDRRPRRGLIGGAVAAWSLATAVSGAARGFGSLFGLRAAVGVGEAGYATLAPTLIDDLAPPGRTHRWLTIFYAAIPIGSALGFAAGGAIGSAFGWRRAFLLVGMPGLLLALLARRLPEPPRRAREPRDGYPRLLAASTYLWVVAGYMAYTFALGGFAFWAPKYLVERFAMPLGRADLGFGALTVLTGFLGTALGALAERFPGRTPLQRLIGFSAVSSLLGFPAALAAVLSPADRPGQFFAFMGLAELLLFASTSPVNGALLKSVPASMRASAMAASIFAIHVGGDLLSPAAIGYLADRVNLTAGLLLLPAAILLSAFFWGWPALRRSLPELDGG